MEKLKGTIIDNGDEFRYEKLNFARIKNGELIINYQDENGEEHEEINDIPEYLEVTDTLMTLEELMAEADKFGYTLVKKSSMPEPLVTCLPCSCGKSKRIRKHIGSWYEHGKSNKYYAFYIFCEKCGKEGPHIWYDDYVDKLGCYTKTQRQMENIAREAWNEMIEEENRI